MRVLRRPGRLVQGRQDYFPGGRGPALRRNGAASSFRATGHPIRKHTVMITDDSSTCLLRWMRMKTTPRNISSHTIRGERATRRRQRASVSGWGVFVVRKETSE